MTEKIDVENQTMLNFLPRYLRTTYTQLRKVNLHEGSDEEEPKLRIVQWLREFVCIPGYFSLQDLERKFGLSYKDMGLYPMDIASALPVLSLGLSRNRSCTLLDLCCSPGAKLQMMAEMLSSDSTIIGVDNSLNRLYTCCSLLEQWQFDYFPEYSTTTSLPRSYLFHCDGTRFGHSQKGNLIFDSHIMQQEMTHRGNRKHNNKSSRIRMNHQLKETNDALTLPEKFDFVLVDAQCIHDASYRHLQTFSYKQNKYTSQSIPAITCSSSKRLLDSSVEETFLEKHSSAEGNNIDAEKEQLLDLQRRLVQNGFNLLKPGGTLVYSTCSQDMLQNEGIISWLFKTNPSAQLQPIQLFPLTSSQLDFATSENLTSIQDRSIHVCETVANMVSPALRSGYLPGTIRSGSYSGMSGHFVAKITKQPNIL